MLFPRFLDRMMQDPGSYDDYERSLALICESSLDVGELGTVQRFLNKYPKMKEQFKNQGILVVNGCRLLLKTWMFLMVSGTNDKACAHKMLSQKIARNGLWRAI